MEVTVPHYDTRFIPVADPGRGWEMKHKCSAAAFGGDVLLWFGFNGSEGGMTSFLLFVCPLDPLQYSQWTCSICMHQIRVPFQASQSCVPTVPTGAPGLKQVCQKCTLSVLFSCTVRQLGGVRHT